MAKHGDDWSDSENDVAVAAYMEMLRRELDGRSFVKAEYRRELHSRLRTRSESAIEWKFQNISAHLDEHGFPRIVGYVPASNKQASLRAAIERWLERHPGVWERLSGHSRDIAGTDA